MLVSLPKKKKYVGKSIANAFALKWWMMAAGVRGGGTKGAVSKHSYKPGGGEVR